MSSSERVSDIARREPCAGIFREKCSLRYDAPMKRFLFAILLCCSLPLVAAPALAQSTDAITIGTRRVIKSQVLNEDRTVYIQLPESYSQSSAHRRYPVLYVLYLNPEELRVRHQTLSARLGERVALSEGLLLFFGEQFLSSFKEPDQARPTRSPGRPGVAWGWPMSRRVTSSRPPGCSRNRCS